MSDKPVNTYDRLYLEDYRSVLNGYEFARWAALRHFTERVLKLGRSASVLDYGCGSGLFLDLWKMTFPSAQLYFCDISPVALEKLADKYPEYSDYCRIVENDRVDFDDEYFDVIVSVEVMEHVTSLDAYIGEIHRLLKPGGAFVWTTPCANGLSIEHIYSHLTGQVDDTSEGYRRWSWEEPTHLRRLKSREAKAMLLERGFNEVRFRFRAHLFSFVCSRLPQRWRLPAMGKRLMLLDYALFRRLPNGASMIGCAIKC